MPGDRREAEVTAERGQAAQEVLDVRLVAGPLAAENVGVDHDERGHAASSYTARVSAAACSQVNLPGALEAERNELVPPRDRLLDPSSDRSGIVGSTSTAAPPATSSVAPPRLVTTGVPQAIASSTGIPKPSYSDG